ncbi:MAG TPA: tetratricopeptide repeat protein [Polyangiaceae bacterium]|nr:tetratricopeptide repeat protein [Polyangiaceae bacterium]
MNRAPLFAVGQRSLAALLVAAHVLSATPGFAQDAERSKVEQLLQQGMDRRAAGQDAEALQAYRQAMDLDPDNARVLAHLGVTYQALGRWVPAHKYLSLALSHSADPYIERHEDELTGALGVVAGHLGQLEVYGGPPGAEVMLNGEVVATLPMAEPLQVTVGSYLLEVQAPGHYKLGRPITVQPRQLTREEVGLAPQRSGNAARSAGELQGEPATGTPAGELEAREPGGGAPRWLPWALGGAALLSTAGTVISWQRREYYADRWNDDQACLGVGVSREQRCGDELDRGQRAETMMWITGSAALAFTAGAVLATIWIEPAREQVGLSGCAPGLGGAVCFGTF